MLNEELHIAIDNYLKGKMNFEERSSFEHLLETNVEAKATFQEAKMIRSLLSEQQFQSISKDFKKDLHSGSKTNWKIGGALGLLILAGASYYIIDTALEPSQQKTEIKTDNPDKEIQIELVPEKKEQIKKSIVQTNETKIAQIKPTGIIQENKEQPENSLPKSETKTIELIEKELIALEGKKEEKLPVETKTVDCEKINWIVKCTTEPSCTDKATGKVRIAKLEGGTKPFKTIFKNSHKLEMPFEDLSTGTYSLHISDANNCMHESTVKIESKNCTKKLELLFQPERDNELEIPLKEWAGKLKLMNNAGSVLYSDSFDSNSNVYKWDGNGTNGGRIGNGVYLLNIEYANGTSELGYITIY